MGRPVLSAEREAELVKIWPHHSDAELARQFGLNVRQAQYIGFKHGLNKTAATVSASRRNRTSQGEPLVLRIERLFAMAGEQGLTRADVEVGMPHDSPSSICSAINKLTAHRRLHRAGTSGRSRWFAQAAHAEAYVPESCVTRATVKHEIDVSTPIVRVAAVRGPAMQPGDHIITEQTRKTVGNPVPGPESRWHANAAPVFSGLKPGQYIDAEAKSWVAAVTGARQA